MITEQGKKVLSEETKKELRKIAEKIKQYLQVREKLVEPAKRER